jgi:hypothetical protein
VTTSYDSAGRLNSLSGQIGTGTVTAYVQSTTYNRRDRY